MSDRVLQQDNRQLIPRWHTSRKALRFQYPFQTDNQNIALGSREEFGVEKSIRDWRRSRSTSNAIDLLVRLRHTNGLSTPEYQEVFSFLSGQGASLSETTRRYINPELRFVDRGATYTTRSADVWKIISRLKRLVRDFPADPMTWMDLAFYYTVAGELDKANKAASIGANQAPSHPYVARSYARYLVHVDQIDYSLHVLERTGLLKTHPLVSSAALAISNAFGLSSAHVRSARKLLTEFKGDRLQLSDLHAALGTLETKAGAHKKAAKLLGASLLAPSENAIAQCSWLYHKLGVEVPGLQPLLSRSAEAEAFRHYTARDFINCRNRLLDVFSFQPFSDLPLIDAGFISIVGIGDPQFVIDISDNRVPVGEMSFAELNNLVVAKLTVGQFDSAATDLKFLTKKVDRNDSNDLATLVATAGMYSIVTGLVEEGRALYERAIKIFEESGNEKSLALANLFYSKQLAGIDEEGSITHRQLAASLVEKHRIYEAYAELGING